MTTAIRPSCDSVGARALDGARRFPAEFRWAGSNTAARERIGNSVPPLFMRAIAEHLRRTAFASN